MRLGFFSNFYTEPGIKLTSVQLHLYWGTLIQDALLADNLFLASEFGIGGTKSPRFECLRRHLEGQHRQVHEGEGSLRSGAGREGRHDRLGKPSGAASVRPSTLFSI